MIGAVRKKIDLLRLAPFDTASEDGRSAERQRRIAWTSVSAFLAKAAAATAMLVSVPLTLHYLGPERFGLWMAISSAIAMLGFADFGLGNGVLNGVAHASGRDDTGEVHRIVSNGILVLTLLGLAIGVSFLMLYPIVPWHSLLELESDQGAADIGPVTLVLVLCFALSLPLGATQKVQLGLQRAYWANLWETLGIVTGLGILLAVIQAQGDLHWIAAAMSGTPVLFRAVNTFIFFGFQKPSIRPTLSHSSLRVIKRLVSTGSLFFVLQLAVVVGFQSDNVIIASILGADSVAVYDVALKLSTLPAMFIGLVVVAQWPAYGEAMTRGDTQWIRSTFIATLRTGWLLAIPFAAALALWGDRAISLWTGDAVSPSPALLIAMAVWSVLMVTGSIIAALLNGLHVVRFQAVNSVLMALANILFSIYLVGKIGVVGAILGTIVSYTIFTLLPCWYYIGRHVLKDPGRFNQSISS